MTPGRNGTWSSLVGVERSHHCANPELHVKFQHIAKRRKEFKKKRISNAEHFFYDNCVSKCYGPSSRLLIRLIGRKNWRKEIVKIHVLFKNTFAILSEHVSNVPCLR